MYEDEHEKMNHLFKSLRGIEMVDNTNEQEKRYKILEFLKYAVLYYTLWIIFLCDDSTMFANVDEESWG